MYRFTPKLVLIITFGCLEVCKISARLNCIFASYGIFFHLCEKKKRRRKHTKVCSLISCEKLTQFWYAVFPSRQASPQHIQYQSDERSRSYECVKITTLLLLLIYSCSLCTLEKHHNCCWPLMAHFLLSV